MIKIPGTIPIYIHPFFWLLAAAIGWFSSLTIQGTLIWIGIILLSVLVHEYGHALTALACRQKVHIELMGFGGVTQREGGRLSLWKEFLIVLNGPLAGFLLCGAGWWIFRLLEQARPESLLVSWFFILFYVNLFWTIINLLPVHPLDGGKLLSLFLESFLGWKGVRAALFISLLFSSAVSLFLFTQQSFLGGSLFFLLAYENWRAWSSSGLLSQQDQNLVLQHLLKEAERELFQGKKPDALNKFMQIRELSKSGVIYLTASEYAAALLFEKGEAAAAHQILAPLKAKLSPSGLKLMHQLAYRLGEWSEAALLGEKVYRETPHYEVALMNAVSHSLLGHVRPAVGWLGCTIRDGLPNVQEELGRKEFDPIRHDPLFAQIERGGKGTIRT